MKKRFLLFSLMVSLLASVTLAAAETQSYTVNGVTFKMKSVEGGTFTMGATPEQGSEADAVEYPAHQVTLSSFSIGETEVSQALWTAVMGNNPSAFADNANNPVEQVSWFDCQLFITKLNELTGMSFRLPTEAEWEFAARGGNRSQGYKYSGSDNIYEVAWFSSNSSSTSHPVATKNANELGIYDMSGNVFEWCLDWNGSYTEDAQTNPTGPSSGSYHISRGGAWQYYNGCCRVAFRSQSYPLDFKHSTIGLRLAMDGGQSNSQSTIEVSTTEINFGVVKEGTDKQETFTVTNTGDVDVTFMVDASTEFTSWFEVLDNLREFTLTPGESKVYTAISHGMAAGWDASTKVFVMSHNGDTVAIVKLKSMGDDDQPLVDTTSLTMMVGERSSVHLKTQEYRAEVDDLNVVDYIGGGPGSGGGVSDGHDSNYNHSSAGLTFTALKPGVAVVTFRHKYTDEVAVLTITVLDPSRPTTDRYAIYNYRNDGDFNAFLNMDVDSITYSKIDLNGKRHPNVVVQEVWTPDSVYRIPLAGIDSIAFKAPEPVMREGLFCLRDYHAANTLAIDSLTLYFSNSILNDSLPEIGQVVVTMTQSSPYEDGFAGKVLSITNQSDGIKVVCERAEIGDIFQKLIFVGKTVSEYDEDERLCLRSTNSFNGFEDNDIVSNITLKDIEFSVLNGLFTVSSKKPRLTCSYYVYVDELIYSISADAFISHDDLSFKIAFKNSDLEEDISELAKALKKLLLNETDFEAQQCALEQYIRKGVKIPIATNGVLNLYLKIAPLFKPKGDLELDIVSKTSARQHLSFKAKGYTISALASMYTPFASLIPYNPLGSITDWDYNYVQDPMRLEQLTAKATGSVTFGLLLQLEANVINDKVIHASVGVEGGRKASATIQFNILDSENPDMNFYDVIKDTRVELKDYGKIKGAIGATPLDFWNLEGEVEIYSKEHGKYYIVPHFTKPALPVYQNESWSNLHPLSLYSTISKDIILKCKPGLVVLDTSGNIVKELYETDSYQYEVEWAYRPLELDITGLSSGVNYRCYPIFSMLGQYIKAGPYYQFDVPEPVSMTTNHITVNCNQSQQVAINGGWGDFSVDNSNPSKCTAELKKNDDGSFYIQVVGLSDGTSTVTVKDLRSDDVASLLVTVGDGQSSAIIDVNPSEIDFGDVLVGQTRTKELTIVNNSTTPQTVTATVSAPFSFAYNESSMSNVTIDVPANSSRSLNVMFTATTLGNYNGNITVYCQALDGGQCVIPVHASAVSDVVDNHEWVDLGLPSGTLWATCNVGASSPEEYGDYFAWGETEPKDYYDWSTYKWCNGSNKTLTKYCTESGYGYNGFVDNKTELDPEDDAAYVNWGPSWRMPTPEQFQELYDNCTSQWTTRNSVNGFLFTASNGKTLFLPAAGYCRDDSISGAGSEGYCWSRMLGSSGSSSDDGLGIDLSFWGNWGCYDRRDGFTVRAVSAPPQAYLTCPDDNHPHMIDLGLPDGTLWACCNVDATKPEEYGGYYAWGETETKANYDYENYLYAYIDDDDTSGDWSWTSPHHYWHCKDLGDSICGTNYDVAYVKSDNKWHMPTVYNFQVLKNNCSYERYEINGVEGLLFVGKNGGAIFMPYTNTEHNEGEYWTANPCPKDMPRIGAPSKNCSFSCQMYTSAQSYIDEKDDVVRYKGKSIRPVYDSHLPPLYLSTSILNLTPGSQVSVDITCGSGSYDAVSNVMSVATVTIEGSKLNIKALALGSATITVKDNQTQKREKIEVTVSNFLSCPDGHHPHIIDLGLP